MAARAWPKWASPYTVGPQTYNPTWGGLRGSNSSFFLLIVLKIFRAVFITVEMCYPDIKMTCKISNNSISRWSHGSEYYLLNIKKSKNIFAIKKDWYTFTTQNSNILTSKGVWFIKKRGEIRLWEPLATISIHNRKRC